MSIPLQVLPEVAVEHDRIKREYNMDVLTLGMMDFILEWEQDTALFAEECFARSKIMERSREDGLSMHYV
jgi:hypothetical protein